MKKQSAHRLPTNSTILVGKHFNRNWLRFYHQGELIISLYFDLGIDDYLSMNLNINEQDLSLNIETEKLTTMEQKNLVTYDKIRYTQIDQYIDYCKENRLTVVIHRQNHLSIDCGIKGIDLIVIPVINNQLSIYNKMLTILMIEYKQQDKSIQVVGDIVIIDYSSNKYFQHIKNSKHEFYLYSYYLYLYKNQKYTTYADTDGSWFIMHPTIEKNFILIKISEGNNIFFDCAVGLENEFVFFKDVEYFNKSYQPILDLLEKGKYTDYTLSISNKKLKIHIDFHSSKKLPIMHVRNCQSATILLSKLDFLKTEQVEKLNIFYSNIKKSEIKKSKSVIVKKSNIEWFYFMDIEEVILDTTEPDLNLIKDIKVNSSSIREIDYFHLRLQLALMKGSSRSIRIGNFSEAKTFIFEIIDVQCHNINIQNAVVNQQYVLNDKKYHIRCDYNTGRKIPNCHSFKILNNTFIREELIEISVVNLIRFVSTLEISLKIKFFNLSRYKFFFIFIEHLFFEYEKKPYNITLVDYDDRKIFINSYNADYLKIFFQNVRLTHNEISKSTTDIYDLKESQLLKIANINRSNFNEIEKMLRAEKHISLANRYATVCDQVELTNKKGKLGFLDKIWKKSYKFGYTEKPMTQFLKISIVNLTMIFSSVILSQLFATHSFPSWHLMFGEEVISFYFNAFVPNFKLLSSYPNKHLWLAFVHFVGNTITTLNIIGLGITLKRRYSRVGN